MDRRGFIRLGAYATVSMLAACGGGGGSDTPPAPPPQPDGVSLTLAVQQAAAGTATLDAGFASLGYEKSHINNAFFTGDNTNLIGLLNALGGGVLRIGGNSVDRMTWTPNGPGQTRGQVSRTDVAQFANCLQQCPNWKVIYGINFAGARKSVASPAQAADEALYVSQLLGGQLLAFEIGNEPDQYGDSRTPNLAGITFDIFLNGGAVAQGTIQGWNQFAQAISNAVSGAAFSGPAAASDTPGWAESFAANSGGKFSLLTEHYYISNYNGDAPSIAGMLAYPDANLVNVLQNLQSAAQKAGVPFRMDETNSYFNSAKPAGVSNVFASALWAIDFIFTHAQYGASGLNFHTNGAITSYSAIGNSKDSVTAVQPLYYALLFFSRIFAGGATGQFLNTTLSGGDAAVSGFAVATNRGATYVIVNNKDTANAANVTVALNAPASTAAVTTLVSSGTTANAQLANPGIYNGGRAITFGGQAMALNGAWHGTPQQTLAVKNQQVTVRVAAASAALIRIQ
ncbi:putative lipoprotein [Burkholderia sp. TJI49]|nr:putative lipoprotein [Burkholderia sp. TJI49]